MLAQTRCGLPRGTLSASHYRFGGKNLKNNHTYLYKALRNPLFKRVSKRA
jgi:hypothetical protein